MEEREIACIAEDLWQSTLERRKMPERFHDNQLEQQLFDDLNALDLQFFKDNPGFKFYWHMQISPDKFCAKDKGIVEVLKKYIGKFDNKGLSQHYIWAMAVKGLDGAAEYLLELYNSLLPIKFYVDEAGINRFEQLWEINTILQAIYRVQDKKYIPQYMEIINDKQNLTYLVGWIILLLGKLKVKEAIPTIIEYLDLVQENSPLRNDHVLSFDSIKALSFFRNKEHVKYIEKFLNPTDIPYVKDKNSAKLYQEYSISAIKKMGANVEETEDSTKQLRKYRIVY